jgi:hypothetical protein
MINGLLERIRQPSITNQPPGPFEMHRNDLAVMVVVLFAFFLSVGVRQQARSVSRGLELGDGLPTLRYPAGWLTSQPDFLHFQARNPASASIFDAQMDVVLRDLKDEESLERARAAWGLQRSQELLQYRELAVETGVVLENQPALRITYGYVADPTRESGANALPVVVQAQDLLFVQSSKLVVVTVAADANAWQTEVDHFQVVWRGVQWQNDSTSASAGGEE